MRILHRYVLIEMLKALALALAAVSGVVCFAMVLSALQQHGLSPVSSLLYMLLSVPGAMYIALPLSAVLAATLVYGRLAADNELMACRASGIPLSSLFWPTILLAIVAAAGCMGLASWPMPESSYAAKCLARADIERLFFTQLGSTGRIRLKETNFQITVDRVVGDMLYGPTLKYRDSKNGQTYCYAPYGRVEFDSKNNRAKLALWEALVVDEAHSSPIRATHVVSVDLPTYVPRREDDLTLWYLLAVEHNPALADRVRLLEEGTSPQAIQRAKDSVRARTLSELHGRLAAALGCFGLVLLGAGLGVYFHSGHLLTAFGVALAPWLGATVLTMAAMKTVTRAIEAPDRLLWLIWAPNVLVTIGGLLFLAYLVWIWSSPVRWRVLVGGRRG